MNQFFEGNGVNCIPLKQHRDINNKQQGRKMKVLCVFVCAAIGYSASTSYLYNTITADTHIYIGTIVQREKSKDENNESIPDHVRSYLKISTLSMESSITKENRITYELHRRHQLTYKGIFDGYMRCPSKNRHELPKELLEPRLLDFVTSMSTNLRILVMGDSVGIQFVNGLFESFLTTRSSSPLPFLPYTRTNQEGDERKFCRDAWPGHEQLLSSPINGGGILAGWRITGMLLRKREGKPPPNSSGGGWNRNDVELLRKEQQLNSSNTTTPISLASRVISANISQAELAEQQLLLKLFDVMIFRIPHGWIDFSAINNITLAETVELAYELFGVSTVLFIAVPFSNNVKTVEDLHQLHAANNLLRKFVYDWNHRTKNDDLYFSNRVKYILVQALDHFASDLNEWNAKYLGILCKTTRNGDITNDCNNTIINKEIMNITDKEVEERYVLKRANKKSKYPISIAQGCAQKPLTKDTDCYRNSKTSDGMQWCMQTIGGRYFASTACMLGCVFNTNTGTQVEENNSSLLQCQESCNKQYMSLKLVDPGAFSSSPHIFSNIQKNGTL